jgi:hypothetical protein
VVVAVAVAVAVAVGVVAGAAGVGAMAAVEAFQGRCESVIGIEIGNADVKSTAESERAGGRKTGCPRRTEGGSISTHERGSVVDASENADEAACSCPTQVQTVRVC